MLIRNNKLAPRSLFVLHLDWKNVGPFSSSSCLSVRLSVCPSIVSLMAVECLPRTRMLPANWLPVVDDATASQQQRQGLQDQPERKLQPVGSPRAFCERIFIVLVSVSAELRPSDQPGCLQWLTAMSVLLAHSKPACCDDANELT